MTVSDTYPAFEQRTFIGQGSLASVKINGSPSSSILGNGSTAHTVNSVVSWGSFHLPTPSKEVLKSQACSAIIKSSAPRPEEIVPLLGVLTTSPSNVANSSVVRRPKRCELDDLAEGATASAPSPMPDHAEVPTSRCIQLP